MGRAGRSLLFLAALPGRGLWKLSRFVSRYLLALFVLVGAVAYVLGVVGMRSYLLSQAAESPPQGTFTWPNAFYFAGTMFVGDTTPFQGFGTYPVTLELARFLAPLATSLGLAKAAGAIFGEQVAARRARHARDQVVVCGTGAAATAIAAGASAEGSRVVLIARDTGEFRFDRETRVIEVPGDPRDPATLRAAGVGRASRLVICSDEGVEDLAVATVARDLARAARRRRRVGIWPSSAARSRGPLQCFSQVRNGDIVVPLQARAGVRPVDPAFELNFFSLDVVGARILAGRDVPGFDAGSPRPVVVVGTNGFGQALVVELARARRSWLGPAAERMPVAIAAPDAAGVLGALSARYHVVRSYVDLRALTVDSTELLSVSPSHIYICDDDPDEAIALALRLVGDSERCQRADERPVVTHRLGRVDRRHTDVRALGSDGILDDDSGRLRFFAMYDEACRPTEIYGETDIRMARAIHNDYVQMLSRQHPMRSLPALRPWDDLPETFKKSNMDQAHGYAAGLQSLGYVVVPTEDSPVRVTFSPDEVEALGRWEHERWSVAMRRQGYRFGQTRVDEGRRLRHPHLVNWDDLPEEVRERNRWPMRRMAEILALVDLQIVRRSSIR